MKIEDFKPEVVGRTAGGGVYVTMLLELHLCAECQRPMLPRRQISFPCYLAVTKEAQIKSVDWRFQSKATRDSKPICEVCAEKGMASFQCAVCKQRRSSDELHESIGDPVEYTCKPCYQTVPAAAWDQIMKDIRARHEYDFCP